MQEAGRRRVSARGAKAKAGPKPSPKANAEPKCKAKAKAKARASWFELESFWGTIGVVPEVFLKELCRFKGCVKP